MTKSQLCVKEALYQPLTTKMNLQSSKVNKFLKMTIAIRFNLLQVYLSVLAFVFAVTFIPYFNFFELLFYCFTKFGGSCHCVNF